MSRSRLRSSSSLSRPKHAHNLSRIMGAIEDGAHQISGSRMIGFPESSQRTTAAQVPHDQPEADEVEDDDEGPDDRHETMSETTSPPPPSPGIDFLPFPHRGSPVLDPDSTSRRLSRSSMMRLENILNDVSIQDVYQTRPRSWSLGQSPAPEDKRMDEASIGGFTSSSLPETVQISRSLSPPSLVDTESIPVVRKKKVKMHRCPECQKDFPRIVVVGVPSHTHHQTQWTANTYEHPHQGKACAPDTRAPLTPCSFLIEITAFGCTYPGCRRTFSVVSNAKRHMRTHGLGLPVDDIADQASVPYIVGFEAPMVVEPQPEDAARREQVPYRLRWMQGSEANPSTSSSTMMGTSGSWPGAGHAGAIRDVAEPRTPEENDDVGQVGSWPFDSAMAVGEDEQVEGCDRPLLMEHGGKGS